ncbi:hypothetical protein WHI96_08045 [Pseudonocardia tropica]|uniref:Uncharacterized protein n=1 Tax=Pseudonocardia tropica TaxID=681289 RepID=A0ABV1JT97_9PSEU
MGPLTPVKPYRRPSLVDFVLREVEHHASRAIAIRGLVSVGVPHAEAVVQVDGGRRTFRERLSL